MLLTKILKVLILLIISISVNIYAYNLDLPQINGYPGTLSEQLEEQKVGQKVISLLHSQLAFIDDPLVNYYLNNLVKRLSSYFFYKHKNLHIYLVNSNTINAFTLPGGYIVINSAIFATANNESELAAVLAHEMAHATQFHLKKTADYNKSLQISSIAAVLASTILAAYNPALGPGALAASLSLSQQAMVNFIRSNEKEADRIGIQALYRAGFDPFGMPSFLNSLADSSQNPAEAKLEYLRTHPLTESRVADTISRANNYSYKQYSQNSNFYFTKALIANLTNNNPEKEIKILAKKLNSGLYQKKYATEYQLALAYNDINSPKTMELAKNLEQNIYTDFLEINYYENNKNYTKALDKLNDLYINNKNFFPIAYKYAVIAIEAKRPKLAINILNNYLFEKHNKNNLEKIYKLLSRAYNDLNNKTIAQKYNAELLLIDNHKDLAIQQLESILDHKTLTKVQKSQIKARIKEIKAAN